MNEMINALQKVYDVEDCHNILEGGCVSGCAFNHIYYSQTVSFYDDNEEEIIEYVTDNFGVEFLVELFKHSNANLDCYKNDVVWCFIELASSQLVDEFETTMIEYEQEIGDTYGKELAFS